MKKRIFLVFLVFLLMGAFMLPAWALVDVEGPKYTFKETHLNSFSQYVWDMGVWHDRRAYVTGNSIYFYDGDTQVWYKSSSDNPTGRRAFYHQVEFAYSKDDLWLVRTDFSSGVYTAVLERRAANAGAYVDGVEVASAGVSFAKRVKLLRLSTGEPALLVKGVNGRTHYLYRYTINRSGIVRTATITYVEGGTPYVPVDAMTAAYGKVHILAVQGSSTTTLASSPRKAVVLVWDIYSGNIDKLYSITVPSTWSIKEGYIVYSGGVWVTLGVSASGESGTRVVLYHPMSGGDLEEWVSEEGFNSFQAGSFGYGYAYIVGKKEDGTSMLILAHEDPYNRGGKEISIYRGISIFNVLSANDISGANYIAGHYGRDVYYVTSDTPLGSGTFELLGYFPKDGSGCRVTYFDSITASYTLDFPDRFIAIGIDEPTDLKYAEGKTGTVEFLLPQTSGSATTLFGVYDRLPTAMGGSYIGDLDTPIGCINRQTFPVPSLENVTPPVTDKGSAKVALSFYDSTGSSQPVYGVMASLYVDGVLTGTYSIPDGVSTYTLSDINLPHPGTYTISASVTFAMGGYEKTLSAGTATVEYVDMFRPTLEVPSVASGTITLTGTAPMGTIYVVVDGATLTHTEHPSPGPYSIDVSLSLGHHRIYTIVEYKGLWSEKSPLREVSVIPPKPVITGPTRVNTPTLTVDVDSVAGLLRVYVDGRENYRSDVDSGIKHIKITLSGEGTHTITADIEVYRVRSDMSDPLVVVYERNALIPPQVEVSSTIDDDTFDVKITAEEGGTIHILIDGVEVNTGGIDVGVQSFTVQMPLARSIGKHTLSAYIEKEGKKSPEVSEDFTRIPKMPKIDIEERMPRGLSTINVWVEVGGTLQISTGGVGVHSYQVKAGDNTISVPFTDRGKVMVKANLIAPGGYVSKLAMKEIFVYDKVEVWIDKREYRINGQSGKMDVAPFIDPTVNRTLVPLRFILEGLGYEVKWDGDTRMITIIGEVYKEDGSTEERKVYMHMPKTSAQMHGKYKVYPGSKMVRVEYENGSVEDIDLTNYKGQNMGAPLIYQNRTFVPVRFISEIFGAKVLWDGEERKVEIQR